MVFLEKLQLGRFFSSEKIGVNKRCDDIVKTMRTSGDSKTSDSEKGSEINPRYCPKRKDRPVKWSDLAKLPPHENYMMMSTEKCS